MARVAALLIVLAPLMAAQPPSLEEVLERAGRYVAEYHERFGIMTAEESIEQVLRPFGSTSRDMMASGAELGQMGIPKVRKMRAEVAVLAVPGGRGWQAFRDVFEVDGKPLRVERNRLRDALADPASQANAEPMSAASLKLDLTRTPHAVNVPTFPLMILAPEEQRGFSFKKKREQKVAGVGCWVLEFVETGPPISVNAAGVPQPIRGELWVEPSSGRVMKTHLVYDSLDSNPEMRLRPERYLDFPRVSMDVVYTHDRELDMWLPGDMVEDYTSRAELTTVKIKYGRFGKK